MEQAGSVVAPDRLTFDFTHGHRLTPEQVTPIEREVNERIVLDLPVTTALQTLAEARASGAMALFSEKYGDVVRVVTVEGFSKELCGGTHVARTGEIGPFIIGGESGIGAGVRRIEAVTGLAAVAHARRLKDLVDDLAQQLRVPVSDVPGRLAASRREADELRHKLQAMERARLRFEAERLADRAVPAPTFRVVAEAVEIDQPDALRALAVQILDRLGPGVVLLAAPRDDRAALLVLISPDVAQAGQDAAQLVKELARRSGGGGGGGNARLATGSSRNPAGVRVALAALRDELTRSAVG